LCSKLFVDPQYILSVIPTVRKFDAIKRSSLF
jgi:hypothetical protein